MRQIYNTLCIGLITLLCYSNVNGFNLSDLTPQCSSQIYCYGDLLHTVQMAKLFDDSKTFVDMKLKASPELTLEKFEAWKASHNNTPSKNDILEFVQENFDKPGSEFEVWSPTDWKENPKFLDKIKDADFRQWGRDLNDLWLLLGRKMTDDVEKNPDLYSIIHVDHPVIVPGGRFREFYYWDSYWIIRGLLHSEMFTTAKGMLDNFLSIIDRFGFIPNGGRVYYLGRSQPPLLTGMIKAYIDETNDVEFMKRAIETLEREFEYWMNNHTIEVNGHILAKYGDKTLGPRPESYAEDVITAEIFDTNERREQLFAELKAAAESGMDFSSRWFIKNGTNNGTLIDSNCRSIVPVELNAILFWNAKIISEFYLKLGHTSKSAEYEAKAQEIYQAVSAVLWHDDIGVWLDYDLINEKSRDYFTPTNLAPLWTQCYNTADAANISEKVLKYIDRVGIDEFPGGVPNSLERTGEQWDLPNVWPPMQYLLIMGLDGLGCEQSKSLAFSWASRWVRSNFMAYQETRSMFEKYNAEEMGGHGGGGEYDVQLGFGWSNGVILELLDKYGDRLTTKDTRANRGSFSKWALGGFATTLIAVIATISIKVFG